MSIMAIGITLSFTKAGGLVGVAASYGPSVGAGYSISESNTLLTTVQDVKDRIAGN